MELLPTKAGVKFNLYQKKDEKSVIYPTYIFLTTFTPFKLKNWYLIVVKKISVTAAF